MQLNSQLIFNGLLSYKHFIVLNIIFSYQNPSEEITLNQISQLKIEISNANIIRY